MATETEQLEAEKQEDADFAAGFDKAPPLETETKAPAVDDQGNPIVAEVKAEVVEEKPPEYVQITKEQLESLTAAAAKTTEFGTKLDRALGTFGNVKEIVTKLQSATPAGFNVEITDEDLAELAADFPELAGHTKAALQKIFGRLKGTAAPAVVETKVPETKNVADIIKEARDAQQLEDLDEAYPEWRETVGKFGDEKNGNKYRVWLLTQPADYQKRIHNTRSALTIGGSIDKFHADEKKAAAAPLKKPDTKIVARQDRISGSVQPRGDGRPPPRRDSSDDDFEKGFAGTR